MNCADFETIVNELAEQRPMDATARVNGLAHVTICSECAARLNDARSVATGLQLALAAESDETPARVKESLLAAFVEHHRATTAPAVSLPINARSHWRAARWWVAAAVAAAAAVVVLALLLPARLKSPVSPTQTAVKQVSPASTDPKPADMPPTAKSVNQSQPDLESKSAVAKSNLPAVPRKRTTIVRADRAAITGRQDESAVLTNKAGNPSEYFPLTYLASATAMESGTVVRIQVSRAKLISLGLPMDGERANELVKADLVLGDDGVARAIRLVE